MKNPWKTLSSKVVYKNPWIRVREDRVIRPDGKRGIYGVVENDDSVYVVPLTSKGEVYLIGQYRYPINKFSWEIPAGNSDGQNLLRAAKRELKEEAGLDANKWTYLGQFAIANGFCNEWGHVYLARGLTDTGTHKQMEDGITAMKKVPLRRALKMITNGEITDSCSIIALTWTAARLKLI